MAVMMTYLLLMVFTIVVVVLGFAVTKRACEKCAREQVEKARTMHVPDSLSEPADVGTTAHMLAIAEGCLDRLVETQGPGVLQDQRDVDATARELSVTAALAGDRGRIAGDWQRVAGYMEAAKQRLMEE